MVVLFGVLLLLLFALPLFMAVLLSMLLFGIIGVVDVDAG